MAAVMNLALSLRGKKLLIRANIRLGAEVTSISTMTHPKKSKPLTRYAASDNEPWRR
ncbi:hypothetical protein CY34DRAFT_797897 [Suillus luteus UH-Slu-Lm8-n1]|uniref:Uncharacterized protein n=1 Tax=Suillus luteus UH-Slu-Lm8-n1 TaxID=930992 RepID=A0A0D0AET2_9AGAM|nr:hypothetical protein CY34DRAFT_797897 [Suillus luteus UH-Slu-Lm8-n1]